VTTLFIVLLVIAASAAVIAQLVWWISGRPEPGRVPPPLVVPIHPRFARRLEAVPAEPAVAATSPAEPAAAQPAPEPVAAVAPSAALNPAPVSTISLANGGVAANTGVTTHAGDSDAASTMTVRFVRPGDEPLQLLPARLEVLSGMTPHQVLRFVRVPGKPAEMILGREMGSSPQHVTLASSTVSRRHARVTCANGRWEVTNLSRTNPVVVNDEALSEFEGARPLADGDRIELGDVVLRFCTS
jgi:hypothetical protein